MIKNMAQGANKSYT